MLKNIFSLLPVVASCLISIPEIDASPLLLGKVKTAEPVEVNIVYDHEGDNYVSTLTTGQDGTFEYEVELPVEQTEVLVYINSQPFGAYVKKGTTTVMEVDQDAVFSGDNIKESEFVNAMSRSFYPMNYKPSPDIPFVYADYLAKLDSETSKVRKTIESLDEPLRTHAANLTSAYYDRYKLQLMDIDRNMSKTDHKAEYDRIISSIDPDADETRLSGMINYWYNNADLRRNLKAPSINEYMVEQFAEVDSALTNEGNKKSLWNTLGMMFVMYQPSHEDLDAFFAAVEPQLSRAPKIKESIQAQWESMIPKVKAGDAIPTDPLLIAPDGSKCHLSDLLGKTLVYIDIWATWCGPCCREIPFMEKLAAQFKNNSAVSFISISRDDDRQAWLKKLDRDKPDWPQYIFDKASGDEFMSAMSINGIPRFLLIGKDGKFVSVDAARPSDSNIADIINSAVEK